MTCRFYRPQTKFAKVMFSQVGGGGGMCGRGACMAGGACVHGRGGMHTWQGGYAWQGVCMACMPPGRYYEIRSMSGRYTSYWNSFLLVISFGHFYCPQRSWGEVVFSEACVKNSVHGGGACMAGGVHWGCAWCGACVVGGMHGGGHVRQGAYMGGHVWQGDMHGGGHALPGACMVGGRGHVWQGEACMAGGMHGGGMRGRGHVWWGRGVRGRYYEIRSMSGRYASYWNAFLFDMILTHNLLF